MKTIEIIEELLKQPTRKDIIRKLKELKKLNEQDNRDTYFQEETRHV